ncbi:MAG: YegS/Rv2252/BmrU family lipid kinase [Corynebacterium sp.]|nr:YegS/Rv2252/BmrU family lipid kinase [Corynebacterium sp.]
MRIALISSLTSGRGTAHKTARMARAALHERGVEIATVIETVDSVLLRQQVRQAMTSTGIDAIVAVGGDGLVHQIIQVLANSTMALGIIPAGTGNDMARAYGIPHDLKKAAELISLAPVQSVDLGLIDIEACGEDRREYFATIACSGFDGNVLAHLRHIWWARGALRYTAGVVRQLMGSQISEGSFVDTRLDGPDGETIHITGNKILTAIGITSSYGGGKRICPGARMDDGLFEVITVRPTKRRKFLRAFARMQKADIRSLNAVESHQAKTVHFTGALPLWADGELIGEGPMTLRAIPGGLRIICPPLPH